MVGPEWWIPALRAISDLNAYLTTARPSRRRPKPIDRIFVSRNILLVDPLTNLAPARCRSAFNDAARPYYESDGGSSGFAAPKLMPYCGKYQSSDPYATTDNNLLSQQIY